MVAVPGKVNPSVAPSPPACGSSQFGFIGLVVAPLQLGTPKTLTAPLAWERLKFSTIWTRSILVPSSQV